MAGPANPAAPKGGFNKLFVMAPVMLAARKLDAEDPQTVQYLRMSYGIMQTLCVLVVLYTFMKASKVTENKVVFVPAPPTPFADPNAKKKYTQIQFKDHVISTARSLLGSTLFGICMTVGLHVYKGMAMGLAIQSIMGPFNLIENPLVKAVFLGSGEFRAEDKIFEEKTLDELDPSDEVVDKEGNVTIRQKLLASKKKPSDEKHSDNFEALMLDTWDAGAHADVKKFVKAVNKENCNQKSTENKWTPLMVLSGLFGGQDTEDAINSVIALGGNPSVVDGDGWNSLHWAAFHGSLVAAKVLYAYDKSLLDIKDNDGKSPLDLARQEENKNVAKFLEEATATEEAAGGSNDDDDDGLRKRK
mmetsp:Transcript_5443/g.11468  ORF Transcript_5443/g.11468 Transcript_5443/m.11468 type:complete len:359 (+) Transcript_5443:424-1500(+)